MTPPFPILADYLAPAAGIEAINPTYSDLVRELIKAQRRVDFHVDAAAYLEDTADESAAAAAKQRIHLRNEERWFDACERIEEVLPKREIANAYKQLQAQVCPQ